jgi:quercetin dioxygenase-like cupin family protein
MSQQTIYRKELLKAALASHSVTDVDIREIRFEPGQLTGRHLHPCPVVGYIASGSALFQIGGEAAQTLPAGSAFYEPANTVIAQFSNASSSEPLTFITFYLLNGKQELIQLLS